MKNPSVGALLSVVLTCCGLKAASEDQPVRAPADLWQLAKREANVHRFSTLFDARDVSRSLASEEGLQTAIAWCKDTGVTKVYIESYRDGYQAERPTLEKARDKFREAGFVASGCVTTTKIAKPSSRSENGISCYSDIATQDKMQAIFEYAASVSDEIMIDDFWFTDCTCEDCDAARKSRTVKIGEHQYPVKGESWEDYRCELMVRLSQERVLAPAKRVNPKVKLIIKYPQWYEMFHERGYEVNRETADFDRIWVGTETRNYNDPRWGGTVQFEGYFIMRWLGAIGGPKCGGGWFDPFGTTESTYLEQARQTVLGGARESMLFCYGALQRDTGPKNVMALRPRIPELLSVAKEIRHRQPAGISAYKPVNSHPERESRVFDFVGMLGLPLVPSHEFPSKAPAAFFSVHALKDLQFVSHLEKFIQSGKPVLLTDGLAQSLTNCSPLNRANVHILSVKGEPKSLLQLTPPELDSIREPMLRPYKASLRSPNRVALYLFKDGSWVAENFNDEAAELELNGTRVTVPAREWKYHWN